MKKIILVDEFYKKKVCFYANGTITIEMKVKTGNEKESSCEFVRLNKDELNKIVKGSEVKA